MWCVWYVYRYRMIPKIVSTACVWTYNTKSLQRANGCIMSSCPVAPVKNFNFCTYVSWCIMDIPRNILQNTPVQKTKNTPEHNENFQHQHGMPHDNSSAVLGVEFAPGWFIFVTAQHFYLHSVKNKKSGNLKPCDYWLRIQDRFLSVCLVRVLVCGSPSTSTAQRRSRPMYPMYATRPSVGRCWGCGSSACPELCFQCENRPLWSSCLSVPRSVCRKMKNPSRLLRRRSRCCCYSWDYSVSVYGSYSVVMLVVVGWCSDAFQSDYNYFHLVSVKSSITSVLLLAVSCNTEAHEALFSFSHPFTANAWTGGGHLKLFTPIAFLLLLECLLVDVNRCCWGLDIEGSSSFVTLSDTRYHPPLDWLILCGWFSPQQDECHVSCQCRRLQWLVVALEW